ncbi:MAG: CCA tRNA nucleotidyltransferase [Actinobacteria bacterium]|nr:CCA tRNA nucleotidyltransferase [Actinomycetota bacterium]
MTPTGSRFGAQCAAVGPLAERFAAGGLRLYLVGGVVRDVLSGRVGDHPDFDLTTDATPDRIRSLIEGVADAVWLQGEKFGTIGARLGERTFEITTHRAEAYLSDSRKPVVSFSTQLEDDLLRRDFTVNAMAVDVVDGTLHDPLGGQADLEAGVLRTPLTPEESFSDDPLRMLRAARFLAGFGLEPAPGLVEAARTVSERLRIVSAERIRDELWRLLVLGDPGVGLTFLDEAGQLPMLLPEVSERSEQERSEVFRRVVAADPVPEVRLAALLMDLSAPVLEGRLRGLQLSGGQRSTVLGLVAAVGLIRGRSGDAWSDEAVRRLTAAAGAHLTGAVTLAALAGTVTGVLDKRLAELRADGDLDDLGPMLGGAQVIELLGIEPGPDVGEAMAWLVELRLSEGRFDPDGAGRRLVEWWDNR